MIPLAVRLVGRLDRAALEGALCDLVERHESLRTVFPDISGCRGSRSLRPRRRGCGLTVAAADEAGLAAALAAAAGRGFDLSCELPLRAHLFELGAERACAACCCCITSPATAGRSVRWRGIWRRCTGRAARGVAAALAPLPVQYADYTLWQQAVLGAEDDGASVMARQLAYWTAALAGAAGADRAAGRPAAAGGGQPSRRAGGA